MILTAEQIADLIETRKDGRVWHSDKCHPIDLQDTIKELAELREPMACGHPKACWVCSICDRFPCGNHTDPIKHCIACAREKAQITAAYEDAAHAAEYSSEGFGGGVRADEAHKIAEHIRSRTPADAQKAFTVVRNEGLALGELVMREALTNLVRSWPQDEYGYLSRQVESVLIHTDAQKALAEQIASAEARGRLEEAKWWDERRENHANHYDQRKSERPRWCSACGRITDLEKA